MYAKLLVFAKIVNQERGQADLLLAQNEDVFRASSVLTNPRFKAFPNGKFIVISLNLTDKTRLVVGAREANEAEIEGAFKGKLSTGRWFPNPGNSEFVRIWSTHPTVDPTTAAAPVKEATFEDDPNNLNGIWFDKETRQIFEAAIRASKSWPVNMMMVGPSGYGKTSQPQAIAKAHGYTYLRMNCATIRDPEEWFGYREAQSGSTIFVPTEFSKAVEAGNAVIVLDEFNRIESWLHNSLFPLLDDARRTTVHGHEVVCGPNLVFVATINDGSAFTGTFQLDAALVNRMDMIVHVHALPDAVEARLLRFRYGISARTAAAVVGFMGKMRTVVEANDLGVDVSTRSSLKVARLIASGMDIELAIRAAVINAMPPSASKEAVDIMRSAAASSR